MIRDIALTMAFVAVLLALSMLTTCEPNDRGFYLGGIKVFGCGPVIKDKL